MASSQWVFPDSNLIRVVDGDTFTARVSREIDYGFHVYVDTSSVQKFRLNRCAAAPVTTPSGIGARVRLGELLAAGTFTLTSVGPYKFGDEWMAEVVLPQGPNVSDVLIAEQWAAAWSGRGTQPLPPWPRTI